MHYLVIAKPLVRTFLSPLLVAGLLFNSGCTLQGNKAAEPNTRATAAPKGIDINSAAKLNRDRYVNASFAGKIEVLSDPFGLESIGLFFSDSRSIIIAQQSDAALLRAASLSVQQRVPMVIYDDSVRKDIFAKMEELGVSRVLLVGEVPISTSSGSRMIMQDPGTVDAMGDLTAFAQSIRVLNNPSTMIEEVAALDADKHVELKPTWSQLYSPPAEQDSVWKTGGKSVRALPAQSARDAQSSPIIVVTPSSSVASAANARAFGGLVRVMPTGNPQDSKSAFAMVAGLEKGPLVALGADFGDANLLSERIRQGWSE